MISKKNIKRWIKKWMISDALHRSINHYRSDKLQKFWFGTPSLPAPSLESQYFRKANLSAKVVRRLDDYRSAALIQQKISLPLDNENQEDILQFAVSPACDWNSGQCVHFKLGDQTTILHDLPLEKWFDVRLDFVSGAESLSITTDAPVEITMPRFVKKPGTKITDKKLRHVIICVLDAWTTAIPLENHPMTGEASLIPNIDRFFSKGLRAKNGVSSGQWTLPAVGSLFTGLHVSRHQMTHPRRWQEFDLNRRTLPEYFQAAGFHTLCGSVVSRITPAFGHNRGFDRFLYHSATPGFSYQTYDPAIWTQEIIGHLEAHYGDKTFSYFQFPDTHPSWHVAPDTRYFNLGRRGSTSGDLELLMKLKRHKDFDIAEQARQLYSLRLAEIDRMFGSVFDYIERHFNEEALVVVTADHGMRMPYLSEAHHNDEPFLTDIRVNIPLFMRGPGIPEVSDDLLCLPNLDIPITLLNKAGIKTDTDDFDGIDLLDPESRKRECVFSEYVYAGIYELAIRGYGHALFLKFKIDDKTYQLISATPIYKGLFPLNAPSYDEEYNVTLSELDIINKLERTAMDHISAVGLLRNLQ